MDGPLWSAMEQLPSRIHPLADGQGAPKIEVTAQIDGRAYRLHVDTGAPGQIALWGNAVGRSGLWNESIPFAPMQRRGIGGAGARGRLVRAQKVRFGSIEFDRPILSLSRPQIGPSEIDGVLGIRLLQQMNIATDIRTRRVWAMRNAQPAPGRRLWPERPLARGAAAASWSVDVVSPSQPSGRGRPAGRATR